MAFCSKCGAQIEDGTKFCPTCGATLEQPQNQQTAAPGAGNDFASKIQGLNNTADSTADFDKEDIEQNKVMGILSYIWLLVLIPIIAAPKSKFARFHANQGLILALTEIGWGIVQAILSRIFYAIAYGLGAVFGIIFWLVDIVILVVAIIGIVNVVNGKAKELPIIGKFRILK